MSIIVERAFWSSRNTNGYQVVLIIV